MITTNPARRSEQRAAVFATNLARITSIFESVPDEVRLVKTTADYHAAVAAGRHAAWLGIQGGNALDAPEALDMLDDRILRTRAAAQLTDRDRIVEKWPSILGRSV